MSFKHFPPEQRRLVAQIGAHSRWSTVVDRTAAMSPANDAREARWAQRVDPDGVMDPETLRKAIASARKAHYRRLALKSAAARRARKVAREVAAS